MDKKRRDMIRIGSALSMAFAAGILKLGDVFGAEWSAKVFDAKSLDAVLKELGGDKFAVSPDITITAPEIAENGAVVPVAIEAQPSFGQIRPSEDTWSAPDPDSPGETRGGT